MGGTKRGSKGGNHPGGFFQLFDRNGKKKWRKLFSARSATVESDQGRLDEENLQYVGNHMMEVEKQGEACCVSSTIDDEGADVKAPSLVARLMGLDCLPDDDMLEPTTATPFNASRFIPGPKKSLHFGFEYRDLYPEKQPNTHEDLTRKVSKPRPQNLQTIVVHERRPINKFQTEVLPTKPVKSYSDIQHRLLSPIKSSGFVSAKNASQLMETAVKILEPRLSPAAKVKKTFDSSIFVKEGNESVGTTSSYRIVKPFEIPKKISETGGKILKGQAMSKSWNGPIFTTSSDGRLSKEVCSIVDQNTLKGSQKLPFSSSKKYKLVMPHDNPKSEDNRALNARNHAKNISLAVQAKANVQKRGNVSCSTLAPKSSEDPILITQDGQDETPSGRQRENQPQIRKNKQKHATTSPNVLLQNNQKHNRSSSKPAGSNHAASKDVAGKAPSRQKVRNPEGMRNCTMSGRNYRSQTRKGTRLNTSDRGIDRIETRTISKSDGDFHRKKRLIEGLPSHRNVLSDAIVFSEEKYVGETNATNSSCVGQNQCNKQNAWNIGQGVSSNNMSTDVVSFTFTSPLLRNSGSHSSGMPVFKQNTKKGCLDSYGEKNVSKSKSPSKSSSTSMMLEGDILSALLEKKLRELTSGIQMSDSLRTVNSESENALPILQDFLTTLNYGGSALKESVDECSSVPHERDLVYGAIPEADISSSSSKLQVKETNGQQSFKFQRGDFLKLDVPDDGDHLSPVSILDTAFSNDTSNSLDSSDGGGQFDLSCRPLLSLPPTAEKDLADSATSASLETSLLPAAGLSRGRLLAGNEALEYIRDIIGNTSLVFEDIAIRRTSKIVSPLLFNRLESDYTTYSSVDQEQATDQRKLWFDVVSECVDSRYGHYSTGDFRSWKRGFFVVERRELLAEDILKDVLQFRSMRGSMVDELVNNDMSRGTGRWMDFTKEECETEMEIEDCILDLLVDEVVDYFLDRSMDSSLSSV